MAMFRTKLESLFDLVHYKQYEEVQRILDDAFDEYNYLLLELNREERRRASYVMSMLDYCRSGRWGMAENQLGPAEEEYYKYFHEHRLKTKEVSTYFYHQTVSLLVLVPFIDT